MAHRLPHPVTELDVLAAVRTLAGAAIGPDELGSTS